MKRTWKRLLPAAALLALPCQAVRADEASAPAQAEAAKEGAAAATPGEGPSGGGGLSVESAPAAEAGPAAGGGAGIQAGVEGLSVGTGAMGSMALAGGMGGGSLSGGIGVAIPQSVDEAISHALRLNPEVQLARAKVDEARAAYNQTRLKVVAEITQLMRKRESLQQMSEFQAEQAKAKLQAAVRDYDRAKSLAQQGNLSAEFVQEAEDALQSAKLDDRQKQLERQQAASNTDSQLLLLIGIEPGGASSGPQQFLGMAMGGATGFASTAGGGEGTGMGIIAGGMGPAGMGGAAAIGGGLGGPVSGDAGTGAAAATTQSGPEGAADGSSGEASRGATTGGAGFGGRGSGGGAVGSGGGGMGMMGAMMGGGGGMAVTAPAFGRPPIPERQKHLREQLDQPTRLEVTDSPLSDVVALLKTQHNILIQIGPGVVPDRPITMSVSGITLKEMLLLMTDLYPDLCFIVRDYGLLVSTREKGVDLYGAAIPADLPLEVAPPGMQGGGGGFQGGGFQ